MGMGTGWRIDFFPRDGRWEPPGWTTGTWAGWMVVMSLTKVNISDSWLPHFDSSKILLMPYSGCFLKTALYRAVLEQKWQFVGQNWFLLGFFFKKKHCPRSPNIIKNCPKLSPKLPTSNTLDPGGSIFTNPELRQIRPLHLQETRPCKSCTTVVLRMK